MKKLEFNIEDKTYVIPEYITISQYQVIYSKTDTFTNDYEYLLFLVSHLSGCKIDDLRLVKKTDFLYVANHCLKLLDDTDTTFYKTLEHNGNKYGFEPRLNEMKMGQYMDLDHFIKEPIKNIHYIFAILYRPLKYGDEIMGQFQYQIDDYDPSSVEGRAEEFKSLDLKYMAGMLTFFLTFAREYINNLMGYLEQMDLTTEQKEMIQKMRLETIKHQQTMDGVGMGL